MTRRRAVEAEEECFAIPPVEGSFTEHEIAGLPEPVRRYFGAAIAPGTAIARAARLQMRGKIKIGRWVSFRADELLAPGRGFVWAARAAGLVFGSDRYVDGAGGMKWKLAGLVPLIRSEGKDVSHSAAGRAVGESLWLPTAVLPRFGVEWATDGDDRITMQTALGDEHVTARYELSEDGRVLSTCLDRWGDPQNAGGWDRYPFGGDMTEWRTFDGVTVPSAGRLGWFYGTDRWQDGEFFRFEITDMHLVA